MGSILSPPQPNNLGENDDTLIKAKTVRYCQANKWNVLSSHGLSIPFSSPNTNQVHMRLKLVLVTRLTYTSTRPTVPKTQVTKTSSHLPYQYRTTQVYDLVKSLSQLTVRVAVDFTSQERIDFYPDTTDPYPFSEYKGLNFLRTGTGRVMETVVVTGSEDDYCPCGECRDSDTPSGTWAIFRVLTSAHVVYDDAEARHTKCRIDYHNDTDPKITISGYSCSSDFETDKCMLTCVSHDLSLVEKLNKSLQRFESLCQEVHGRYNNSNGFQTFIAVVSHPHGCPMQVSLGKLTNRFEFVGDYYTAFTYNTSTCPGSSGAPVFIMARDVDWWGWTFCHRGGNEHGNHCGSTWEA